MGTAFIADCPNCLVSIQFSEFGFEANFPGERWLLVLTGTVLRPRLYILILSKSVCSDLTNISAILYRKMTVVRVDAGSWCVYYVVRSILWNSFTDSRADPINLRKTKSGAIESRIKLKSMLTYIECMYIYPELFILYDIGIRLRLYQFVSSIRYFVHINQIWIFLSCPRMWQIPLYCRSHWSWFPSSFSQVISHRFRLALQLPIAI